MNEEKKISFFHTSENLISPPYEVSSLSVKSSLTLFRISPSPPEELAKVQGTECLPSLPELSITEDVEKSLDRNPKMKRTIAMVYDKIATFLQKRNIGFFAKLLSLKYSADEEREIFTIKIEITDDIPYEKILRLWDEASQLAHENLSPEESEQISVILDKVKRVD